jgi:hypothetical protein
VRPSLVVIDPVPFFIGGKVDMHRANEVRQPLAALGRLAEQYGCAIVLVIHMNKGQAKSLYRALGSIDFQAAVRSTLLAGRVEHEPERGSALFHIKSNNAKLVSPIGFDVLEDPEDDVGTFTWRATDLTMVEVEGQKSPGRPPTQLAAAETFLREILAHGPQALGYVKVQAEQRGISWGTLKRASQDIYLRKEQVSGVDWVWSLRSDPPSPEGEPEGGS